MLPVLQFYCPPFLQDVWLVIPALTFTICHSHMLKSIGCSVKMVSVSDLLELEVNSEKLPLMLYLG